MDKNAWNKIISAPGFELNEPDFESEITNDFVKTLRQELNMSQAIFARLIGVSKKTVEKWEQGVNRVKGGDSRLIYLLSRDHSLVNMIMSFEIEEKPKQYRILKNDTSVDIQVSTNICPTNIAFFADSGFTFS